jgi:hypothetical protein
MAAADPQMLNELFRMNRKGMKAHLLKEAWIGCGCMAATKTEFIAFRKPA